MSGLWLVCQRHSASPAVELPCVPCWSLQAAPGEELTIDVMSSTGKLQFKADMQMSMTAWMKALQEASQLTEPPPS